MVMAVAERRYTTSWAMLEAMREAGVRYLFANLGSDHTGIVETYAQAYREIGRASCRERVFGRV